MLTAKMVAIHFACRFRSTFRPNRGHNNAG